MMLEKLSHIKNPLSVIAIFAGLAEVSGTVVLPLLDKEVQHQYVWFLMGFPCLLVVLFFVTLWTNYVVLYAPSDFSNDQIFADLLVGGSPAAIYKKLQGEIRSDGVDTPEVTPEFIVDNSQAEIAASEEAQVGSESQDPVAITVHGEDGDQNYSEVHQLFNETKSSFNPRSFETALVAEELAFGRLSQVMGGRFHRNMSMRGLPGVVYDGVLFSRDSAVLVEVKFTRTGLFAKENIRHSFSRAKQFCDHLPKSARTHFEFKFVIVHAKDADVGKLMRMQFAVSAISSDFPFKTDVVIYEYEKLKEEVQFPMGAEA